MRALLFVATVAVAGCGRLGYEERAPRDGSTDSPVDARIDATLVCPPGMTEIAAGAAICIDLTQSGPAPWTDALASCNALGVRLCADAEWFQACTDATGLTDMIGFYEWVAEESGGTAQKRGAAGCSDSSAHVVTDAYDYRCCAPKR